MSFIGKGRRGQRGNSKLVVPRQGREMTTCSNTDHRCPNFRLVLHRLIVKKVPAEKLFQALRPAIIWLSVVVAIEMSLIGLAATNETGFLVLAYTRLLSYSFMFFFLAFMYGSAVFIVRRKRSCAALFRNLQDRLLILCAYATFVLACWIAFRLTNVVYKRVESPLFLRILRNLLLLTQGTFDSVVLGNLCGDRFKRRPSKPKMMRRQTSDNRIRMGQSVTSAGPVLHSTASSSFPSLRFSLSSQSLSSLKRVSSLRWKNTGNSNHHLPSVVEGENDDQKTEAGQWFPPELRGDGGFVVSA